MKELKPLNQIEFTHTLAHELAQPLTTISVYISGCIYRLTTGTPEKQTILHVMNKIMQEIECAQQIILRMNNYINNVEIN
ncbi:MAG: hypothetical protein Q8M03_13560 [Legionella sp.]|nr:hypothetical protein [Legionella sp.]